MKKLFLTLSLILPCLPIHSMERRPSKEKTPVVNQKEDLSLLKGVIKQLLDETLNDSISSLLDAKDYDSAITSLLLKAEAEIDDINTYIKFFCGCLFGLKMIPCPTKKDLLSKDINLLSPAIRNYALIARLIQRHKVKTEIEQEFLIAEIEQELS